MQKRKMQQITGMNDNKRKEIIMEFHVCDRDAQTRRLLQYYLMMQELHDKNIQDLDKYYKRYAEGNGKHGNIIRRMIQKEIEGERKLRDHLNRKAEDHPIISKVIIVILTGILLGLLEDCIHDSIQESRGREQVRITNIYVNGENYAETWIEKDGYKIWLPQVE